ncbi:MAG: hypothetical protein DKT66_25155 [Candidatus Melainabacteria bacterium]|nr:MAG: hypothetical protein DKT66_25155 [Candidatus Melainabacteria bacterium]
MRKLQFEIARESSAHRGEQNRPIHVLRKSIFFGVPKPQKPSAAMSFSVFRTSKSKTAETLVRHQFRERSTPKVVYFSQ